MAMTLIGSGDEFSLLRECAQICVGNGGDWYNPGQMLGILSGFVGEPALLADSAFIGMATPECILRLLEKAEASTHLNQPAAHAVVPADLTKTRGYHAMRHAVECLLAEARFVDEEGEETKAIQELLDALAAASSAPQGTEQGEG